MHIVLHEKQARLVSFDREAVRLFDISSGEARPLAEAPLAHARWISRCDDYVAVLVGELAPANASVARAQMHRFSWDLTPLGTTPLGEVEKRGLSLTADGSRLVVTEWSSCAVNLLEATTGRRLARRLNIGIPSGAAISPDGTWILVGSADQGSGDLLLLDTRAEGGELALQRLDEPESCPGLDDAPYFGVFGRHGRLAALTNESWGGRGLFVFDIECKATLWGRVMSHDGGEREPEDWRPLLAAFAHEDRLLLVRCPGAIEAYRSIDGLALGSLPTPGDGQDGLAVEGTSRIWILDGAPRALDFPPEWLAGEPLGGTSSAREASGREPTAKMPVVPDGPRPGARKLARSKSAQGTAVPTRKISVKRGRATKKAAKKAATRKDTTKAVTKRSVTKRSVTKKAAKKAATKKAAGSTARRREAQKSAARTSAGPRAAKKASKPAAQKPTRKVGVAKKPASRPAAKKGAKRSSRGKR